VVYGYGPQSNFESFYRPQAVGLGWPAHPDWSKEMKGPGMRLDLDVRRVWQCPACGREIKSEGQTVSKACGCTKEGVAMRLVEKPRPKPTVRIPQPPIPDPDIPELSDFPTDLPVNPASAQLSTPKVVDPWDIHPIRKDQSAPPRDDQQVPPVADGEADPHE
jgi:hypothetical protein